MSFRGWRTGIPSVVVPVQSLRPVHPFRDLPPLPFNDQSGGGESPGAGSGLLVGTEEVLGSRRDDQGPVTPGPFSGLSKGPVDRSYTADNNKKRKNN